jgi:hypothetical protein
MAASPVVIDNDLSGLSLADVLERLEAGKCGHRAVMEWLRIDSYHELVSIMHFNGRTMPGHRPMIVTDETMALIRSLPRRVTTAAEDATLAPDPGAQGSNPAPRRR